MGRGGEAGWQGQWVRRIRILASREQWARVGTLAGSQWFLQAGLPGAVAGGSELMDIMKALLRGSAERVTRKLHSGC